MLQNNLEKLARKVAKETEFILGNKIYQGLYYNSQNIRDIIFEGKYKNQSAALKVYDDPRITSEPIDLELFHKYNKSKIIIAPALYRYKIISPNKGWMIMEKLPSGGQFFSSPLSTEEKNNFFKIYLEYRKNFPQKPTRRLILAENLPANQFHIFRINRWLELATIEEAKRLMLKKDVILKQKEFIPRFSKALKIINHHFAGQKMIWCHGHFKPNQIYKTPSEKYYLTDFAHTKMYPKGYELAFIIWADHLMPANWRLDYRRWKQGIDEWIKIFKFHKMALRLTDFDNIMKASLAERIIGTILADVCASGKSDNEKTVRIKLLYKLFDEII